MKLKITFCIILMMAFQKIYSQNSVARRWNEVQLMAIRQDLARPPVQARNLFHVCLAMYDAWSVYDGKANPFLLGNMVGNQFFPFNGINTIANNDTVAAQEQAISYAAYRVLRHRYANSPNAVPTLYRLDTLMQNLGYDINYLGTDYANGTAADVGNYIAAQVIQFGLNDTSNEINNYTYNYYVPSNAPLVVDSLGNPNMSQVNKWQPITLSISFDQNNNPVPNTPKFICPEWGRVIPFALPGNAKTTYTSNGNPFPVYYDPGTPPQLNLTDANDSSSLLFKWGHQMVATWSSHLDPDDTTMIDISPNHFGNVNLAPSSFTEMKDYYRYLNGGDTSNGYTLNPITNLPYTPNLVRRGDYTRVVSQYWADGPNSETPPGHWFVLLNRVGDHPLFVKKMEGSGITLSNLEWDIKSYFVLGGAMHDAAIAAWGIKGWYDSPRPISAIRLMAGLGQSSDSLAPHYHPGGLQLIPDYIELIMPGDTLAGANNENLYKIKIKSWLGFSHIANPSIDYAKVGWILGENWRPYQRKTFVTPPFAGYVSGHSTYSRTAAEILTSLTGSAFFPGGLFEEEITSNSGFLVFEQGPSQNLTMQWASYMDASNQASLSRIWGGIHPPFDDIPGRLIGREVANSAFAKAKTYFGAVPLPLTLISFNAFDDNCNVVLEWQAALETNMESYSLFASQEGSNTMQLIGQIPVAKDNLGFHNYRFVDQNSYEKANYYLVENDVDGNQKIIKKIFHSRVGCGDDNMQTSVSLYPNPADDYLKVSIQTSSQNETATIEIIDLYGRQLLVNQSELFSNTLQHQMDIRHLAPGNYFLKVTLENGDRFTKKIFKK